MSLAKGILVKHRQQEMERKFNAAMKYASNKQYEKQTKYVVTLKGTDKVVGIMTLDQFTAWAGRAAFGYQLQEL